MKRLSFILFIGFMLFPLVIEAQYLPNPSFEGPGGENDPPEGWERCFTDINDPDGGDHSVIAIDLPASHGDTYLSMRVRGTRNTPDNHQHTKEFCYANLTKPLQQFHCYILEVDLAYDDSVIYFGAMEHVYPTVFRLCGAENNECLCAEELAVSEVVDNEDWKTFRMIFIPQQQTYNQVRIEPDYAGDSIYNGMLLVDNIRITDIDSTPPEVMLDTMVWEGESVTLTASDGDLFSWQPTYGIPCPDCQSNRFMPTGEHQIVVSIWGDEECPSHEVFNIGLLRCDTINPERSTIKLDTTLTDVAEVVLQSSPGRAHQWFVDREFYAEGDNVQTFDLEQSTYIESIISDEYGCKSSEIFLIKMELSYPNVITPNGDGKNDVFRITGVPPHSQLEIFTRSGERVYFTTNYTNNWDGDNLPEDTYWFTLTNNELRILENGFILLKR